MEVWQVIGAMEVGTSAEQVSDRAERRIQRGQLLLWNILEVVHMVCDGPWREARMSCRLDGGGYLSLDGCGWGISPLILFSFKKGGKIVNYLYFVWF